METGRLYVRNSARTAASDQLNQTESMKIFPQSDDKPGLLSKSSEPEGLLEREWRNDL